MERYAVMEDVKGELKSKVEFLDFQTPVVVGSQLQINGNDLAKRYFIKLDSPVEGDISISLDGGATSKNVVDVDGNQVTSLSKGFVEVVAVSNFFILRNSGVGGGISDDDLQQLIAIANEAEANESVMKTNYINAVQTADSSIVLPSDASWNDILLQIPNINAVAFE